MNAAKKNKDATRVDKPLPAEATADAAKEISR